MQITHDNMWGEAERWRGREKEKKKMHMHFIATSNLWDHNWS
jgi:hypothetical protein